MEKIDNSSTNLQMFSKICKNSIVERIRSFYILDRNKKFSQSIFKIALLRLADSFLAMWTVVLTQSTIFICQPKELSRGKNLNVH